MNKPQLPRAELPAGFDLDTVQWYRLVGGADFDYPVNYAVAVVDADVAAGRIELLVKWEPNAYCHYHSHLGTTRSAVLRGEQHLVETRPHERVHKVRRAGFQGAIADGDTHMEYAGPEGLTMLFSIHAEDGRLFDLLDQDGKVFATATIEDLVEKRFGQAA